MKFLNSSFVIPLLLTSNLYAQEVSQSSADSVWKAVSKNVYSTLPSDKVTFYDLFDGLTSLIERSALRTLNTKKDILPEFKKLAHPNGVCLKGEWSITQSNPYSGLFKKNSKAIIIARASTALSETTSDKLRGFGFAGKLFPTMNPNLKVETANFFLIDDLGGTNAKHYTDVEMTNEPKVTTTAAVLANLQYALTLATTFQSVDRNPTKRQVYEISEAMSDGLLPIKTPKWMMIKTPKNQMKVDESDFRDELLEMVNQGQLTFNIYVADEENAEGKNWKKIGNITISEAVASRACDHQLHFHHPKWKPEIE